jgi:6-phospho-beta-glucosidase
VKITVIGGGSTYTPELVNGFLWRRSHFPLSELCLMDIDPQRLSIVGGFAQRMATAHGSPFRVTLSTDQREAVTGASYVITQLRVGLMAARREDEYLGQRHGLIGQETTGVGGMAKAMRTIPVIASIAEDMRCYAPGALLANFTNPSGLIAQALKQAVPEVNSVGVCNVPITTKMTILEKLAKLLGVAPMDSHRASLDTLGLNHLSWHRGFRLDGQDVWPQVFAAYLEQLGEESAEDFDRRTVEALGMIPNYYLQYYYYTAHKLVQQNHWPPSRAEEVMVMEQDMLRQYADPGLTGLPADLMKRGGAYYSTMAVELLNSHHNDLGEIHVVNTWQAGAVPGWPADWVLELPCRVNRAGIHPLSAEPLPQVCFGLLAQVKAFELLTVQAALLGDRHAAYQALLAHPLGPRADRIQAVLDDLLRTNRPYLPQFFN